MPTIREAITARSFPEGGGDMRSYRCFFLDDQQHIKGAEIIEAEALREAVSRALESFEARPQHRSVEIWFGANRIYQAEREDCSLKG